MNWFKGLVRLYWETAKTREWQLPWERSWAWYYLSSYFAWVLTLQRKSFLLQYTCGNFISHFLLSFPLQLWQMWFLPPGRCCLQLGRAEGGKCANGTAPVSNLCYSLVSPGWLPTVLDSARVSKCSYKRSDKLLVSQPQLQCSQTLFYLHCQLVPCLQRGTTDLSCCLEFGHGSGCVSLQLSLNTITMWEGKIIFLSA